MPRRQEKQNENKETRQHLLDCAKKEFLEKGYMKASLRNICKEAGVTTGALYFFFKDKDDLFTSLVAPQLNTLKAMLTEHMRQELLVLDSGEDAAENDFRDDAYASQQVLHLLYQNYDLFLLLLTGSYGSSLEHFVDELVAISEEHYRKLADRQAALLGVTPPQLYAVIYAGVLACYLLIDLVLVRRLDRMTPAEVLKNRE